MRAIQPSVSHVAVDSANHRFCPQFQRGQRRILARMLGHELVDRNATATDVLPGGFGDWHARQEVRCFRIVAVSPMAIFFIEPRQNEHVVFNIRNGLKRRA